ncbi:hypothetical protein OGATHE_002231 [Ogataea polymorpha]|uniref:Uncharacterized protein n=1 Tax=Ogataea polymorpha TaxID=460523 RepID=A0A9P8TB44_9ASCO|nr:hypothetical protein OGATHE_002231 [Ogataea polymorpha]
MASPPPVMHPAIVPFHISFLARKDSMLHSTPEKISPMYPKFLADDHVRRPISVNWIFTCCLKGRSAICCDGPGPIPGATSSPRDVVDIAEGVDIQHIDVGRTQQQVLYKTGDHVVRVQKDKRPNEVQCVGRCGGHDEITESCFCENELDAEVVCVFAHNILNTLHGHKDGSKYHVNH